MVSLVQTCGAKPNIYRFEPNLAGASRASDRIATADLPGSRAQCRHSSLTAWPPAGQHRAEERGAASVRNRGMVR